MAPSNRCTKAGILADSFGIRCGRMTIKLDDLTGAAIQELLRSHLQSLSAISPPESMHALDLNALRKPEITFWSVWDATQSELLGCGALKELEPQHAEIKSMRTAVKHLRKGVASAVLQYILNEAKRRNYQRLSLETGSSSEFIPARTLYTKFGFTPCGPFADYIEDPNSVFMTRRV